MLEIKFKPLLSCRIKSKSTEKFFTLQFVLFNTGEFIEPTKKIKVCYIENSSIKILYNTLLL